MYGQAWAVAVVVATMLMIWRLNEFNDLAGFCLQCGGRGAHRDDCPLKEK